MTISLITRYEVEAAEGWEAIRAKVPSLKFPIDWKVTLLPPFGGAVVRFYARLDGQPEDKFNGVSVYLDWHNKLGCYWDDKQQPLPYWEAYPIDTDTARYGLKDVEAMIRDIDAELRKLAGAA